ncbi:hypothetical protein D3C79_608470 [compost metagenome]
MADDGAPARRSYPALKACWLQVTQGSGRRDQIAEQRMSCKLKPGLSSGSKHRLLIDGQAFQVDEVHILQAECTEHVTQVGAQEIRLASPCPPMKTT